MITVKRVAEPPILIANSKIWTKAYILARNNYSKKRSVKNKQILTSAEGRYGHIRIKEALINMCHGKCVYCESHVTHVSYPHIEHFKPKSRFPKLCFSWKNLFLACAICNSAEYKASKWPTSFKNGPFINPELENPRTFFDFVFDAKTGVSIVKPKGRRAKMTEKELGLNRADLVKHRNAQVQRLAFIALKASKGDKAALVLLKSAMLPNEEYSAFAISFFRRFKLK